jgi:putative flippase GtrA
MAQRMPVLGRFLSVGALNTVVGLLVIYAAKWFWQFSDLAANATGYAVGLGLSFVLNSRWTFAYRGAQWPALVRFLGVTAAAYAMNLLTVMAAIRLGGVDGYIAQALGILPYTVTAYLGSRYIAFRGAEGRTR